MKEIGVGNYPDNRFDNLKYAAKDVQDVASFFKSQAEHYSEVNIRSLLNEHATKDSIAMKISVFFKQSSPDDIALLYVSGHGFVGSDNTYFVPFDYSSQKGEASAIPFEQFEKLMSSIPARNRLIFLDACHSGNYISQNDPILPQISEQDSQIVLSLAPPVEYSPLETMNRVFLNLTASSGATIIAASRGTGQAFEDPKFQNGLFTHFLLEGMENRLADTNRDGQFAVSEVQQYLVKAVLSYQNERSGTAFQVPNFKKENVYLDVVLWNPGKRKVELDKLFEEKRN